MKVLKEIAPSITRVLTLCDPDYTTVPPALQAIESVATSLGLQIVKGGIKDKSDIERVMRSFSEQQDGGLTVIQSGPLVSLRDVVGRTAMERRLPGVYPFRAFVASGGLASYGINEDTYYARAPFLIGRILNGEKPEDIPVLDPPTSELVISRRVAQQLGLSVPRSVLDRASEIVP